MKQTAIEIGYSPQLLHRIKLEVLINEFRPNEISILEEAFEDAWRRLERQRSLTPTASSVTPEASGSVDTSPQVIASHRPSLGHRK